MIQFSDGAGFTSPPLKAEDADEWLKNHLEQQRKIKEAKNTFKNRILICLSFIGIPVLIFINVILCIPMWLFTGKTLWFLIERLENKIQQM